LFLQIDVATIRPDCGAGRDAAGTAAYNVDQSSTLIIAKAQQKANNICRTGPVGPCRQFWK